jgi:prepilin-type N-terminal cleavage/methylation domain-containing protein
MGRTVNQAVMMIMLISITGKLNNPVPGCRHVKKLSRECGFTLLELIIVCALAAIFLTLSMPALRNTLLNNDLDSATRKIIGTVKELRNLAVREHASYLLHFELGEGRIWYEADEVDNNEKTEEISAGRSIQLPVDIKLDEVVFSSQTKESLGSATLWISNKGYMDQTTVYLSDSESRKVTIIFSPFSGSARVYDEFVTAE